MGFNQDILIYSNPTTTSSIPPKKKSSSSFKKKMNNTVLFPHDLLESQIKLLPYGNLALILQRLKEPNQRTVEHDPHIKFSLVVEN